MAPKEYYEMTSNFLQGHGTARGFSLTYMNAFKRETQIFEERVYLPLQEIFEEADAFDPFDLPGKELFQRLNEREFREATQKHLVDLGKVLADIDQSDSSG